MPHIFRAKGGDQASSFEWKKALLALAVLGAAVGGIFLFKSFLEGGFFGGTVRNCIASVLGNPPECSDCDDVSRLTTLNGRSLGPCRAILPAEGDMCHVDCNGKKY